MFRLPAVLAVLTFGASTVQAASYNYYGALAIAGNGATGSSTNRANWDLAKRWAVYYCSTYADDCGVAIYFVNTCAALARGDNGGYGTAKASALTAAKNAAMTSCNTVDYGCRVLTSGCSKG